MTPVEAKSVLKILAVQLQRRRELVGQTSRPDRAESDVTTVENALQDALNVIGAKAKAESRQLQ